MEPLFEKVSIYDGPVVFLRQFIEVNREQGLLMAAHWCMSEVCNGGFHQFFGNSTGVLGPEAVRGFGLLGIATIGQIAAQAVALLGSPYPRDREKREIVLNRIQRPGNKREKWDPFNELDDAVYAWGGSTEFDTKADDLVKQNLDLFFK